jgi:choline-sulfatase
MQQSIHVVQYVKKIVLCCLVLSASMVGTATRLEAADTEQRPNFVFIMTDDQGPWALGAAGDPNALTPNLDQLRMAGALLTRCYVPTPVCSPVRASVLTGLYGTEVGITDYLPQSEKPLDGLSAKFPTWPGLLSQAGYATALVGKYHCGEKPEAHPTKIGYGEFTGFIHGGMVSRDPQVEINGKAREVKGWTPDILTDHAIDFIRRKSKEPFALSLHFWAPHANQNKTADGDRTWMPLSPADWKAFQNTDPVLPDPDFPDLDIPRTKRMMREYLASVHSVDRNLGRLFQVLDELKLDENTVVIFTSDHGYNLGHHGIWHKGNGRWLLTNNRGFRANMWEHSLRVPAIVRWPGKVKANSSIDATVSHLDWFPTILSMAGIKPPPTAKLRGRNVQSLLRGGNADWNHDFFAQFRMRVDHGDGTDMRSFQTERWKLVRFFREKRPDEFYDRVNDPEELTNLADSTDPVILAAIGKLKAKMRAKMREVGDPALP